MFFFPTSLKDRVIKALELCSCGKNKRLEIGGITCCFWSDCFRIGLPGSVVNNRKRILRFLNFNFRAVSRFLKKTGHAFCHFKSRETQVPNLHSNKFE